MAKKTIYFLNGKKVLIIPNPKYINLDLFLVSLLNR